MTEGSSVLVLAIAIVFSGLLLSGALVYSTNQIAQGLALVQLPSGGSGTALQPTPVATPAATPQATPQKLTPAQVADLYSKAAGVRGNESASVTILEFSDYQCPFCRRHYNTAAKQIEDVYVKTGKAKIAWMDFPLSSIHPMASASANAVRCAGEQGKYWEGHDAMFEGENKADPSGQTVPYTVDNVKTWLGAITGIDKTKLNACIDSNKYASVVKANFDAGAAAGVQGTPTLIINGEVVSGAQAFDTFKQVIDAQLG